MKTHRPSLRSTASAFTLVEIMIVVVIIGLLTALALPAILKTQRASQNSSVANDFRVFAQVFETYCTQNGKWPANAGGGVVPSGMGTGDLKVSVWQATTPIGGKWNWDYNTAGVTAGVSIQNFTCTDAQLQEIDAKIDDGDLTTGLFQKTQANRVTYILEQ